MFTARHPKLAWIGRPYFAESMRAFGWEVFSHDYSDRTFKTFTWEDIVGLAGWEPDVLVLGDKSLPPTFIGLERFPCLTVFHCVDSHIHSWYPAYAQAFDLCSVSLKDHLGLFLGGRLTPDQLLWSPPFVPDDMEPLAGAKQMDLLFVGTVDAARTPGRQAFLQSLARRFPGLVVRQGCFQELYPQARLVLNVAEKGDLNFRVFEALACQACLLTPNVGHGFRELFKAGRDLFVYPQNNMDSLLRLIHACLRAPGRCLETGRSGYERVDRCHRARHRAAAFDVFLESVDMRKLVRGRLAEAGHINKAYLRLIYLHWAEAAGSDLLKETYLRAATA